MSTLYASAKCEGSAETTLQHDLPHTGTILHEVTNIIVTSTHLKSAMRGWTEVEVETGEVTWRTRDRATARLGRGFSSLTMMEGGDESIADSYTLALQNPTLLDGLFRFLKTVMA